MSHDQHTEQPFSEYQRVDAAADILYRLAQTHGETVETHRLRDQPQGYIETWRERARAVLSVADETDAWHKIVRVQHV